MKKEVVGEVFKTRDYDKFNLIKGNRTINMEQVVKLKRSFQEKQLPIPIIVDKSMNILDGQHRWYVCKENNLDLYFTIIEDINIKDIVNANTVVSKWGAEAYYDSFLAQDYPEYAKLEYFKTVTGCSLSDARLFMELSSGEDFKTGNLVCSDFDTAYLKYQWYTDFKKAACFGHRSFKSAIKKIFSITEYEHERMIQQLDKGYWNRLQLMSNAIEYVNTLSEIYNIGKSKQNVLQFNVDRKGIISTYKRQ